MAYQLTASATLINDKVKFSGVSRDNAEIMIDYVKPIGDEEGYTSLELFLVSLASCSGTAVALMLRKMQKDVSALKVIASGDRREEHPTYFKRIYLRFELKSNNAGEADMQRAIKLSEDSICPVWNMVKNNVEITHDFEIIRPE